MSKGRGRGRGSSLSFNVEALGIGRGESIPASAIQPRPDYPPLKRQPVQLLNSDDQTYLLSLQQNFERRMRSSPYYIRKEEERNFLDRYSDKYKKTTHSDDVLGWEPDWNRIPEELKLKKKRKKVKKVEPKLKATRGKSVPGDEDVNKKLEELEQKDNKSENPDEAKKKDDDKDAESSEVEVEAEDLEDDEDDNDYLHSYFDNGESYLDEEEDALEDKDGAIY